MDYNRLRRLNLLSVVVASLNLMLILLEATLIANEQTRVYEAFDLNIPHFTRVIVYQIPGLIYASISLIVLLALTGKEILVKTLNTRLVINNIVLASTSIFIVIYTIALFLPLLRMRLLIHFHAGQL